MAEFKLWMRTWYGSEIWRRWNGDGTVTVQEVQIIDDFLDANQAMANNGDSGWNKDKTLRRASSIPLAQVNRFRSDGLDIFDRNNAKILKRIQNDPDYRKLRTAHWKV